MSVERSELNVARSGGTPRGAVFLSYASQDADASRQLCEALRAAGVEVWFDQNELVGGDAWDAKIRKQISECALFVPVISAATQARREGYFRLEWKLAAQRTHMMSDRVTFLLPVVIDATRDADADVPSEFKAVQWTRLRPAGSGGQARPHGTGFGGPDRPQATRDGGQALDDAVVAAFCGRVQRVLLGAEAATAAAPADAIHAPSVSAPARQETARPGTAGARRRWLRPALGVAAALAVFAFWQPWRPGAVTPPAPASSPPAVADFPRDPELRRARQLLYALNAIAEDFVLAEDIVKPLLAARPNDPEVAIVAAEVAQEFLARGFDLTPVRRAQALRLTERAVQMAPDNPQALTALGRYLLFIKAQLGRAEELVRRALALNPGEARVHRTLYEILAATNRAAEADAYGTQMAARFPADPLVSYDIARRYKDAGDLVATEQWLDRTLAIAPVATALVWKAWLMLLVHADPAAMKSHLDRIPERQRLNARVAHAYYVHALVTGDAGIALPMLESLTDPWMTDFDFTGPRSLLIGDLRQMTGRTDLARVQYEAAGAEIQRVIDRDPTDLRPRRAQVRVLEALGRTDEARAALRLGVQALARPVRWTVNSLWYNGPIRAALLLGERETALELLRESAASPTGRQLLRNEFRLDPRMKPFRDDPVITALLAEPAAAPAAPVPEKSVAVLPFAALGAERDTEFFAEAMHDEVITHLAKVRDLRVISRTSVLAYRDAAARNVRRLAVELGVAHVLEATVHRQGRQVRVSAKLIDARQDEHRWAESFTGELTDVFALQARLAQEIATALQATLTPGERALINRRPTENAAAYEVYQRARREEDLLSARSGVGEWERVAELYTQALALDPGLALAHARLARLHGSLYWFSHHDPSPARRARAEAAVRAAERIAPDAPETHYAQGGFEYFCRNDWRAALVHYDRALAQLPNDAGLIAQKAYAHRRLGEWPQVVEHLERVLALNPADHYTLSQLADHLHNVRRNDRAVAVARRLLAKVPDDSYTRLVEVRAQFALDGDVAGFLRGLEAVPPAGSDPERLFPRFLRAMYARDFAEADALLQRPQPTAVNDLGGVFTEPVALPRARVALLAGRREEVRSLAEVALRDLESRTVTPRQRAFARLAIAQAKALLGRIAEAVPELRAAAVQAAALDAYAGPIAFAEAGRTFIAVGRREEALEMLREVVARPARLSRAEARLDPFWSQLRDDPRFEEILGQERPL